MAFNADAFMQIISANFGGCPHRDFVLSLDGVSISDGGFRILFFDFDTPLRYQNAFLTDVQTQGRLELTQNNALDYYEEYTDMPVANFLFYAQNMYEGRGRFAYALGDEFTAVGASQTGWGCIPQAIIVETTDGEEVQREVHLAVVDARIELVQNLVGEKVWRLNVAENGLASDPTLVCDTSQTDAESDAEPDAEAEAAQCLALIGVEWSSGDMSGGGGIVPTGLAIRAITNMNIKFIPLGIML